MIEFPLSTIRLDKGNSLFLTSSPTFALRDSGGGFPLVGSFAGGGGILR